MKDPFPGYDDHDVLRDWILNHENRCGHKGVIFKGLARGENFAGLMCLVCGHRDDWLPWPRSKKEQKARRLPSRRFTRLDEDRCQVCLATRVEVQLLGLTLEPHHLIDRSLLIDAGLAPDELKHLAWMCSADHPIVTARRQAVGRTLTMLHMLGVLNVPVESPIDPAGK